MKILSGEEIFQISIGAGGIRFPAKVGGERSSVAAAQEEIGGNPEEIGDFPQQDQRGFPFSPFVHSDGTLADSDFPGQIFLAHLFLQPQGPKPLPQYTHVIRPLLLH